MGRFLYIDRYRSLTKYSSFIVFYSFINRQEFVQLYIDFVLNRSIEPKFNAFYAGFMNVCDGPVMNLFQAHELMKLIIGNENIDWHALERLAKYRDYTVYDQTV